MAKMHLRELLSVEQEPFVLKTYINERRSQLRKSPPKTQLQLKRPRPISRNPSFPRNLCRNPCFFSANDCKSTPLFDFTPPNKSPCRMPNNAAAVILEAALFPRSSSLPSPRQKTSKNLSFGLLASLLKRISLKKKKAQKKETCGDCIPASVMDIIRWDSFHGFAGERRQNFRNLSSPCVKEEILEMESSLSCECSDSFEESGKKSTDLDVKSSCSCSRGLENLQEMEFRGEREGDARPCEKGFCSSPLRFRVPQRGLESGFHTPVFSSPTASPLWRAEVLGGLMSQQTSNDGSIANAVNKEDGDEKDQFSPVSVLDPPFEDDEDEDDGVLEEDNEIFKQSFKRAKQNLLSKIQTFEQLAQLNHLELERRAAEEVEQEHNNSNTNSRNKKEDELLIQEFSMDMRGLVLDLVKEETGDNKLDSEVLAKVCERIDCWKDVGLNTIDMTVELDLKGKGDMWRKNHEEVGETVAEIELAIFGLIIEELWIDLVHSSKSPAGGCSLTGPDYLVLFGRKDDHINRFKAQGDQ